MTSLLQFGSFRKNNVHVPYDPTITLLGIYAREMKTYAPPPWPEKLHTVVCCNFIDEEQINGCQELRMVRGKEVGVTIKE